MRSKLEIVAVPAFADNYLWLVHDADSGETAVVDPGDPDPVLAEAERRGWRITTILNTHWHPDHTGGNLAIKEATGATIIGPAGENGRVPGLDVALREGDRVRIGEHEAEVWEVPGHTIGHIAYVFRDDRVAFVGDTLFAMGCGRLFEGSPEQMHRSLGRLASLPDDFNALLRARIYAGQCALRRPRLSPQSGYRRATGGGRGSAHRGRTDRPDDGRGGACDQSLPACPRLWRISPICGGKRTIFVLPKFRLMRL